MTHTEDTPCIVKIVEPDVETRVSSHIYGQYFEHVEDCVYPGVMDGDGVREDVIAAAAELQVPVVRWPGGCFADCYHWEDGIGPREERPVRMNWHWGRGELENNKFGTHEFLEWCERTGASPYINVNMGTGDMIEALRWLDYTTGDQPTSDVAERRRNGREDPWPVSYWGLGNETWGSWEAGRMGAGEYADKLANWADFFRRYQPDARIVGVGSHAAMDADWDRTVLDAAGEQIDLLSLHIYGARVDGGDDGAPNEPVRRAVMLTPLHFEAQIGAMAHTVRDHNRGSVRQVGIAIDEWNIRHYRAKPDGEGFSLDRAAPRTGTDAIMVAGVFHAMIRAADLVTLANYVFLVNGNAVLDTRNGQVTKSALFPMFQNYRQRLTGLRLDVEVAAPSIDVPVLFTGNPGAHVDPASVPSSVPVLDAVAVRGDDGKLEVALLNRSEEPVRLTLDVPGDVRAAAAEAYAASMEGDVLERVDIVVEASGEVEVPGASCTFISVPG